MEAYTSTVVSVSGGDSSATSRQLSDMDAVLSQIDYALHVLDPITYPQINQPTNRTRADFTG